MPKLSVIIPTYNSEEHLREALECLITQSEDDFEVIIVDCRSTDKTVEIIDEFCNEYVDFYRVDFDSQNPFASMNKGFELAKGAYVWFYAPDGFVTDRTVEAMLESAAQNSADAVSCRLWHFGDFDPYYDMYCDTTAVLPRYDKYERTVLWDNELSNKIFRRAALISKKLRLPENFKYAGGIFNLKAAFSGMKISGCGNAVYQRREKRGQEGFSGELEPTLENAKGLNAKMTEIIAICEDEIRKDAGTLDGDEAYLQEAYYTAVSTLIDGYYRYFWHLTPETFAYVRSCIEKYLAPMGPEKQRRLWEAHKDLNLPLIYKSHEDAAKEPAFSMLLDIPAAGEEITEVVNSLYIQEFPFFELFVTETQYNSPYFPGKWKDAKNLRVLSDSGFHSNARRQARSKINISLRDGRPLDRRVLRKVHMTAAPAAAKPLIFTQTKNSFNVKKSLKDRGLNF